MNKETIYIKLLDEGVEVYRPTLAEVLPDGSYKIESAPDYDPEDESWEFLPGQIVICERKQLHGGLRMVAKNLSS